MISGPYRRDVRRLVNAHDDLKRQICKRRKLIELHQLRIMDVESKILAIEIEMRRLEALSLGEAVTQTLNTERSLM
jgi:hypothetical protein